MFTGIIQNLGRIHKLTPQGSGAQLIVQVPEAIRLQIGDSLAVNGVCLTCTSFKDSLFHADLSQETLTRTHLGNLSPGNFVNLEMALAASASLSGHMVQGHIDDTGVLKAVHKNQDSCVLTIEFPEAYRPLIVPKGSIAIDGISLTVNEVFSDGTFSVCIIPHTYQYTTIQFYQPGRVVNLEFDIIGKYVQRFLQNSGRLNA